MAVGINNITSNKSKSIWKGVQPEQTGKWPDDRSTIVQSTGTALVLAGDEVSAGKPMSK